jgi:hypothetical protein
MPIVLIAVAIYLFVVFCFCKVMAFISKQDHPPKKLL